MLRRQGQTVVDLPLAPHVIGRQHGVKRAKARAPAHIAGQTVAKADAVRTRVIKKTAAQKQIAGRADGRTRARVTHQGTVLVIEMDAVGIDGALTHQAEVVVGGQVAARLGK